MATGQRRKTRIRTSYKGKKRTSPLWIFLSLVLMVVILLSLFFLRAKIAEKINIFNVDDLVNQDSSIRNGELNDDTENGNRKDGVVIEYSGESDDTNNDKKDEYKKEDLDYLNRIIKRK